MSDILFHTENGVATITFDRVEKKNSFTAAMYAAMAQFLKEAAQDDAVRVVVFQGHPTVFSAGNDIADFLHNPPSTPEAPVFQFLQQISGFPKPVVAAVAGPAVGIGTTLLFHCDLVYAGDNAAFAMPFVNLGLCPEAGSSLLAPRLMGHARAAEALLLGEPFQAEAALEMGLVNRIVPPTEVNALAQRQAAKLASKPMSSLLETKRLLTQTLANDIQVRMAEEATSFGRMLQEPAAKEAFTAFMEKRVPDFSKC
ncbi:enoyl-CoA hydratase [Brachymonas denitrificans]|jgi:enoyl-CoA hydratase/carnithine racemase|uniref:Enoyl-CoA hydratase/carnithine racemase n=1 Tax=Brachymonas denitrificans DSM 15123 TaxID=1121117 RepID=A0A1H8DL65_9BURK|nr:enoyl-CoA hydratase [Brachymonas denitrificans]SEN07895.1 Enoyl-CoA hydratase/carnithine racemase [Brachymonas denitrificans DSM 15123]